jgi:L-lysine 2,3-aminomutase
MHTKIQLFLMREANQPRSNQTYLQPVLELLEAAGMPIYNQSNIDHGIQAVYSKSHSKGFVFASASHE